LTKRKGGKNTVVVHEKDLAGGNQHLPKWSVGTKKKEEKGGKQLQGFI